MIITHHAELYLSDGDLVIHSNNGDGPAAVAFRVHKGLLAYNSPIFRDMLALPCRPDVQDGYDGAPLVRLSDEARELESALGALYNPSSLAVRRWDPGAPNQLSSAMRIAKKYEIDSIRARVVAALEDSWPRTFADWLRFRGELAALDGTHHYGAGLATRFDDCVPEPASAIRLARDHDIPGILPFAFYTLATIGADHDWDAERAKAADVQKPEVRTARWSLLPPDGWQRVLRGRERLMHAVADIVRSYTDSADLMQSYSSLDCEDEDVCIDAAADIASNWEEHTLNMATVIAHARCPDPLALLEKLYNCPVAAQKVCGTCHQKLKKRIRDEQKYIWDCLPDVFALK
ncbi:hypothetical protein PsYK624_114770 [Phanerochaete sordida]|uniref:BTB domain-containing protein n=1 Tax=Phanerochaete sordida TaxID=48140 RepID=A0A9P3GJA9_9APHY|nr:hypothetical protein PsYK624_114770 [Phanerochaete sordida]